MGASPSVASSRMSSRGLVIRARPMASICCSPPDSSAPAVDARPASSGNSSCTRSSVHFSPLPSAPRPARAVAIRFSRTVRLGKICRPSGTSPSPRRARSCAGRRVISAPSSMMRPPRAAISPVMAFTVVVLPMPLRPSSETASPAPMSRSTPCSTCPAPYPASSPRTFSMIAPPPRPDRRRAPAHRRGWLPAFRWRSAARPPAPRRDPPGRRPHPCHAPPAAWCGAASDA